MIRNPAVMKMRNEVRFLVSEESEHYKQFWNKTKKGITESKGCNEIRYISKIYSIFAR